MQFLGYNICKSLLFLKVVLIQSYAHTLCTTYSEQKDQTIVSVGRLEGDKYNGTFLTVILKGGRGRFREDVV